MCIADRNVGLRVLERELAAIRIGFGLGGRVRKVIFMKYGEWKIQNRNFST